MGIEIADILKEHSVTLVFAVMVSVVGLALKVAKSIYDFYEEYIIRRSYRRIADLSEIVKESGLHRDFLSDLKNNEVFRVVSGIKSSPKKSKALMRLYLSGNVSLDRLQGISRYLEPSSDGGLKLSISRFEKFASLCSLVSASIIFFLGLLMATQLLFSDNSVTSFLGMLVMLVFSFLARLMSKDFRNLRDVKKIDLSEVSNNSLADER